MAFAHCGTCHHTSSMPEQGAYRLLPPTPPVASHLGVSMPWLSSAVWTRQAIATEQVSPGDRPMVLALMVMALG